MRLGKLTNKELSENVLSVIKKRRPEVLHGVGLGQDCASFRLDDVILITGDPITGADNDIGRLAIKINANDVIAAGGECVLCTMTVLAPSHESVATVKKIVEGAEEEAVRYGLEIVGGHTEFTPSVVNTVVSVTMIGKAKRHFSVNDIKAGDSIVMTKYAAIEGTAILAAEDEKAKALLDEDERLFAKTLFDSIGIEKEGRTAREIDGVHSMHDVTEGGLFGAVSEMAEACSLGAEIFTERVPVLPITEKLCKALDIDVFRLISSGALLIATDKPDKLLFALNEKGIKATNIGVFNDSGKVIAVVKDKRIPITAEADKLFYKHKRGAAI